MEIPDTCTNLEEIVCSENRLTSLTIHDTCTKLKKIYCYNNQLTSMTIPDTCTKLDEIICAKNLLTSLAIPEKTAKLGWITCDEIKFILILCSHKFRIIINGENRYTYCKERTEQYLSSLSSLQTNIRLFV